MDEWSIPALSITVVHHNEVVFQKALGKRDYNSELLVDTRTIFPIGSLTKAFTTTTIAILAEQGILDWDEPIVKYIPDFQMYDQTVTEQLTLRDICCHRSGLPRHDLAWYAAADDVSERVRRIRYLQPSQPFRSVFQYNNLMYMVAGYVMECASGSSWQDLVSSKLLQPLGMNHTVFSLPHATNTENYAHPHLLVENQLCHADFLDLSAIAPAGSLSSNIEDMTSWVRFQVNGAGNDTEIVSRKFLSDTHSPHMAFSVPTNHNKELPIQTYGLGWGVCAYRGYGLVWHDGGVDGFSSNMSLLPSEELGLVILANLEDSQSVLRALSTTVIDEMLGLDGIDWNGRLKSRVERSKLKSELSSASVRSDIIAQEGLSTVIEYTGKYRNPGYATTEIVYSGGRINLTYYRFTYHLRWRDTDTYDVDKSSIVGGDAELIGDTVSFVRNAKGIVTGMSVRMEPDPHVKAILFTKV